MGGKMLQAPPFFLVPSARQKVSLLPIQAFFLLLEKFVEERQYHDEKGLNRRRSWCR